ncbi:MAG TPA: phosphoribosylformylglycinamidine cyclo-ligase, partial [Clostridiales bacterium]|nr:phosphoribosylformylglycinamidine cyclo-ligase [Clostridiales bacterium]
MFNTFNMGVGMTATVDAKDVNKAISVLRDQGVEAYALGEIVKSENGVTIC